MIKLGKLPNGVALFDMNERTKVVIQKENEQNILVCFDTTEYDKVNSLENWFVKDFDISRKDNPDICEALDKLYIQYYNMVKENRNKFSFVDYKAPAKKLYLFRTVCGDKIELLYPSEDNAIENSTWLGLTRFENRGYMLTFHKSVTDKNKKSVLIRNSGSRIPDLFPLYEKCFNVIELLAIKDVKELDREFYQNIEKEQLNAKHLNFTK